MKKLFLSILLLSISQLIYAQNYKQVKIYFENKKELSEIYKLGLDIDEGYIGKDNSISVFISSEKFPLLVNSKFNFEILIEDWFEHFRSRNKMEESLKQSFKTKSKDLFGVTSFNFGSMGGYYTMQEVYNELDNMRVQYPNLISAKFSIGVTFEGRNMYVAKISDNPAINENEPKIFFNSLTHCREPQGMMAIMYYMFYLLENYGTDPEVTFLVNNREIYFLPVVNPDGYEYNRSTNPNGGGMWRKNRRGSGTNVWGIDLNRNFGYKWGYDDNGSSPYQSDETYRGASAFSEPETQVIRDFCIQKNFNVAMNYHTYSNLCLSPWGYFTQETPDSLLFREFQKDITDYNGYTWGTPGSVLYNVNGGADDWMYGEQTLKQKTISMTIEIGNDSDGFWPDQNRIFPLAEENLEPNLYLTWIAGEFVNFVDVHFDQEYLDPGENINMTAVIKNMGLGDASDVSIELSSPDPKITINAGVENVGTVVSQHADSNGTPLNFTISDTVVPGSKLPLIITIKTGTTVMDMDTVKISIGTPTILFADETDDPVINWTLTSSPSNYKWEATSTSFYSPITSFTESKSGNYPNNATITMVLKNPIDLANAPSPFLSYWTKWNMETDWDYGQVSITTNNGTTWIPLAGEYMNIGTGSFQPGGQPLYDGTQSNWIKEEIDLTPYAGSQIKLRFQLKSDGSQVRDGWYIDDIKILYYNPGMLTQNMSVVAGWNMISIPLLASDMKVTSLFPSATSNAYEYTGIYNAVTEFSMGDGYWLKFDSDQTFPISGSPFTANINLQPDWNIIGPFLDEINVADISTIPENIINSNFFGYNGIYVNATELTPGKSYWIKSSQAGELILNPPTNKNDLKLPTEKIQLSPDREIVFTLTDSKGKVINLNSGLLPSATNNIDRGIGESVIPPVPPSSIFYAAFELTDGERILTDYRKGDSEFEGKYEYQIFTSREAENNVTLKCSLPKGVIINVSDVLGSKLLNYIITENGSEISIPSELNKLKIIVTYDLPAADLQQFNSNIINDAVTLSWTTSKERDNSGFIIERSKDGINFENIAFINGKGKFEGTSEYFFNDTKTTGGKYYYRIGMKDFEGRIYYSDIIEAELLFPSKFELQQNYPNPFNPSTTIKFELPVQSNVTITLYDVLGKKIDVIASGIFDAGYHRVQFEKNGLSTGVYIYTLTAESAAEEIFKDSKKMVLMK